MQDLKITLVQANLIWENSKSNLANFDKKLDQIENKSDLIVLPEMFNSGFTMNVNKCAESLEGESVQWLREKAKNLSCVIAGSLLIKENNKYFNRIVWMRPDGTYECYNKRHLFRMIGEQKTISQGDERKIVTIKDWKINLQICYDLRFPVWSRNKFENNQYDYDALLYVSNWPEIRNEAYIKLLAARAIENQVYVIWVNRVGQDGNEISHSGDTMLIDPIGKISQQAKSGEEEILDAKLSREVLNKYRNKFKFCLDWDKFSITD